MIPWAFLQKHLRVLSVLTALVFLRSGQAALERAGISDAGAEGLRHNNTLPSLHLCAARLAACLRPDGAVRRHDLRDNCYSDNEELAIYVVVRQHVPGSAA